MNDTHDMWPLSYFVGLGLSWSVLDNTHDGMDRSGAIDAAVAAPVYPDLGVGVHLRGSHIEGTTGYQDSWQAHHSLYTYDVAATLHASGGRVLFAPWVGLHLMHGSATTSFAGSNGPPSMTADENLGPTLMVGALLSFDLWQSRPHAIALYGELQVRVAGGSHDAAMISDNDTAQQFAATLGLAYRH